MKNMSLIILLSTAFISCAQVSKSKNVNVISVEDVKWEKLNPARGDKSPQAGTLWGDRKGKPATGFLAKFVDGFSSPPHIHNVSYRAIVIDGLIHNDDPKAANMWMPNSSYWTQPAGEAHITSARGQSNIALVEIDHGPYLVKPISKEYDNGQRPYNIHASNIIWKQRDSYQFVDIWKNEKDIIVGSLLKFKNQISMKTKESKYVLITGNIKFDKKIISSE